MYIRVFLITCIQLIETIRQLTLLYTSIIIIHNCNCTNDCMWYICVGIHIIMLDMEHMYKGDRFNTIILVHVNKLEIDWTASTYLNH